MELTSKQYVRGITLGSAKIAKIERKADSSQVTFAVKVDDSYVAFGRMPDEAWDAAAKYYRAMPYIKISKHKPMKPTSDKYIMAYQKKLTKERRKNESKQRRS
jgi:hypothetical protein